MRLAIMRHLPPFDLKSTRLVSRKLSMSSRVFLYETVHLRMTPESFHKVEMISDHRELNKLVRNLIIDRSIILPYEVWDEENWFQRSMRVFWSVWHSHADKPFYQHRAQFNEGVRVMESNFFWNAYVEFIKTFRWQEANVYRIDWRSYRERLSNLDSLSIDYQPRSKVLYYHPDFMSLPPHDEEWMYDVREAILKFFETPTWFQVDTPDIPGGTPSELRDLAILSSASNRRLKSLTISANEPWDVWGDQITSQPNVLKTIRNLTSMDLHFGCPQEKEKSHIRDIGKLVTSNTVLQSLRLSFYDWREPGEQHERHASLSDLFAETPHWPHLYNLALEGFEATRRDLQHVLKAQCSTMRSLSLGHITIEPDRSDPLDDEWAVIIPFLASELQLSKFNFSGNLMLSGVETLVINVSDKASCFGLEKGNLIGRDVMMSHSDYGPLSRSWPKDCLKYRFESWVTGQLDEGIDNSIVRRRGLKSIGWNAMVPRADRS